MINAWNGFEGGLWQNEINVRDFIQRNYTAYDGDKSFLAGPTDATQKLWDELQSLQAEERRHGGVLDMDTDIVSTITSHKPGYINERLHASVPEARMLSVQVWDKGLLKVVEKAIRDSGLGLNPMNDGQMIRIPIPPLSEERRIELCKIAGKYTETARISARNVRREALDAVKKMKQDNEISEDEQKRYETEIQTLTDKTIATLDEMYKNKEVEIKQI